MNVTLHPDVEPLRERLRALQAELRSALDDWHQLSTETRPRLQATYNQYFGDLERDLQVSALKSAELFRRVELLSIKVQRGETLTTHIIDLVNQVVDAEYARLAMRIHEVFELDAEKRERQNSSPEARNGEPELTAMYRTLAKQLHPDVASGSLATDPTIWHRVQRAYAAKNVSQMKSLLSMLGTETVLQNGSENWDLQRWHVEVERLETRVRVEQRKVRRLRSEEPFTLEAMLDSEHLRDRHRSDLLKAIHAKKRDIEENTIRYSELTGGMSPSDITALKTKDEQRFDDDFLKNTYFGQR